MLSIWTVNIHEQIYAFILSTLSSEHLSMVDTLVITSWGSVLSETKGIWLSGHDNQPLDLLFNSLCWCWQSSASVNVTAKIYCRKPTLIQNCNCANAWDTRERKGDKKQSSTAQETSIILKIQRPSSIPSTATDNIICNSYDHKVQS